MSVAAGSSSRGAALRRPVPRIVAGALFAGAVVALAALAAWPVYRDGAFLLLVAVAAPVGASIAAVAWGRRWGGWTVAGALAAAFLVLAVPLGVPSRRSTALGALGGLGEAASGLLFAWKDLVTVDLPVGAYRNLLIPALVVFLVGTCAVLLLAWRTDRGAYAAVPVAAAMLSFGLFFGRTTVSAPLRVGPLVLGAPVETALGIAGLLTCLLWLAWRSRDERLGALRRAAVASGVRTGSGRSRLARRRTALGAGMLAVAVVAAAIVVPFAARGSERDVLRSSIGPEVAVRAAVSPLAQYRAMFADERAEDVLFTVTPTARFPSASAWPRSTATTVRSTAAAAWPQADGSRFVRVPSILEAGAAAPSRCRSPSTGSTASGCRRSAGSTPSSSRGRGGVPGRPRSTTGPGRRRVSRRRAADWRRGRVPDQRGRARRGRPRPDRGTRRPADRGPAAKPAHVGGRPRLRLGRRGPVGARRAAARARLSQPRAEIGDRPPTWMQSLPGYTFQPSASGHSLARIDAMFARLLEREADPRTTSSDNFVAAVGDDEQFAVAVALIAQELGFPSRVVVGARLVSTDAAVSTCRDGACRAQDLSAWAEVQAATGEWIPVDATPQSAQSPSLEVTEQRNPENVTEVRPDAVEDVVPPDPLQEDSGPDDRTDDAAALDLAWLWPVLRITGIVLLALLLLAGPFAVIIAAKAPGDARGARRAHRPRASSGAGTNTSTRRWTPGATRPPCSRAPSWPRGTRRRPRSTWHARPTGRCSRVRRRASPTPWRSGASSIRSAGCCFVSAASGAASSRPYR